MVLDGIQRFQHDAIADLEDSKLKSGLAHRADIDTCLRRQDAEEGRDHAV